MCGKYHTLTGGVNIKYGILRTMVISDYEPQNIEQGSVKCEMWGLCYRHFCGSILLIPDSEVGGRYAPMSIILLLGSLGAAQK
jgi:hypothetical protein